MNTQTLSVVNASKESTRQSYPNPITMVEDRVDIFGITISKSNKLVEAQNRLAMREQKVLAACLALINPMGDYPNGITVQLSDQQLETLTGIKKRNIYEFIDKAAKNYHSIPIETPGKKPNTVDYINIAHRSVYDPDERVFTMTFHPEMEDHLLELVRYTSYQLQYLVKLTTKYAMRLYELLCMSYNRKRGGVQYWKVPFQDIYFPLGLTDINGKPIVASYVNKLSNVYARVIDPSIAQINEMTDLQVSVSTYQNGRKAAGFLFRIQRQEIDAVEGIPVDIGSEKEIEDTLCAMGISQNVVANWLKKYGMAHVAKNMVTFKERLELGKKIDNPAAYLNYFITNNIAELPEVANPYSERYKNNRHLKEFVKRIVMPIWWRLDEALRKDLAQSDLVSHQITMLDVNAFTKTCKELSPDEAEMIYDKESTLFEWNQKAIEIYI